MQRLGAAPKIIKYEKLMMDNLPIMVLRSSMSCFRWISIW
jgi:hypothetical protein